MTTLRFISIVTIAFFLTICFGCKKEISQSVEPETALSIDTILGNPNYLAMSYGGYREGSRDIQPTIEQLKEDMLILSAMGVKIIRTYNVHLPQAENILKAITILRSEQPDFEMYVMLGAWIDCENAWQEGPPNHDEEDVEGNTAEIGRAVALAQEYPEIVKIIAVGNEAMVHWAHSYYVKPGVILKWVNHLQDLKDKGELSKDLWITSSDNFASWGGGDSSYHVEDLEALIKAVDFVSLHTYPMHDTHYHSIFWGVLESELHLPKEKAVERAMKRALLYAKKQYLNTVKYIHSIDSTKPVHIGETGWASESIGYYGPNGSKACDEFKEGLYYKMMRKWTKKNNITCFYFEAFNEKWKDPHKTKGSENHFGLFTIKGEAKYALWNMVDKGAFDGLSRDGHSITKTYQGDLDSLMKQVELPPMKQLK